MLLAITVTGFALEAAITVVIAIIGIVLAIIALLYAVREKPLLTIGRRVGLAIIGVFALFVWSGFFLGPALAILAAIVPPYNPTKKWKHQAIIKN
jgi:hypothetical protein